MTKDQKPITFARPGRVRLIDISGEQLGIIEMAEALKIAATKGLDLMEVGPNADPPVCKIVDYDYGKIQYQKSKKQKASKKTPRKEVRFSVRISEHDLLTKRKQTHKFLEKGHEVNISIRLKGRERAHPEAAVKVHKDFLETLQDDLDIKVIKEPIAKEGNKKVEMLLTKGDKKNVAPETARTPQGSSEG